MMNLMLLLLCICMAFGTCFSLAACTNDPPAGGSDSEWMDKYY